MSRCKRSLRATEPDRLTWVVVVGEWVAEAINMATVQRCGVPDTLGTCVRSNPRWVLGGEMIPLPKFKNSCRIQDAALQASPGSFWANVKAQLHHTKSACHGGLPLHHGSFSMWAGSS